MLNLKREHNICEKYESLPVQVKAAVWFMLANFIVKGLSFFSSPLFAYNLTEDQFGKLSLFNSYKQLLIIICTGDIHLSTYQRGLFRYKEEKGFTLSILFLMNCMTLIIFMNIFLIKDIFFSLTEIPFASTILLMIVILLQPAYNCWTVRKRIIYDYKPVVVTSIVYALIDIFGSLMCVIMIDRTAHIKFNASLCIGVVVGAIFYIHTLYQDRASISVKVFGYWPYSIKMSLPIIAHAISYYLLAQADQVMIGNMVGKKEVAYYSAAYNVANGIIIFQSSLMSVMTPWMYRKLEKQQSEDISKVTNSLLMVVGFVIAGFITLIPELFNVLYPNNYLEAIYCIPPISLGVYFMFLYSIFVQYETYYEKTKYIMYVSVFCALFNIIMNYVCIRRYGYYAGAWTTLASYVLYAIGHYYFARKVSKMTEKDFPFDIKFIIVFSSIMSLISVAMLVTYPYVLLRLVLAMIILLVAFCNRKHILSIIKSLRAQK